MKFNIFRLGLIDMGRLCESGLFPPNGDKRICNKYDRFHIPFHEWLFSVIGLCLPFNDFEVGDMNHLMISHLQLHPVSYPFVKVFQN